ncbi:MAG: 6,7-dimethyl-8-ribityllumazine synthase [Bacteroidia bacterium]|nr:6,7-dimethyl-8-ribityllumazine synthase [Bacteroidia bacterium]MDW8334657.1 6,7-dimethyl-8-ribityllumazine synthase [Bacteroidia bacterium]
MAQSLTRPRYRGNGDHTTTHIIIVQSRWHEEITDQLCRGALETLKSAGVPPRQITVRKVPGAFEIPLAVQMLIDDYEPNDDYEYEDYSLGVIALGCIVKGETPHNVYISENVARSLMDISLAQNTPVGFGIITADTMEQALERAGGSVGNKGVDAAVAVLEMIDLLFAED